MGGKERKWSGEEERNANNMCKVKWVSHFSSFLLLLLISTFLSLCSSNRVSGGDGESCLLHRKATIILLRYRSTKIPNAKLMQDILNQYQHFSI